MCALQPGQFVDDAASLTSCLRLHSKHETTRLRCRLHIASSFRWSGNSSGAAELSLSFSPDFGADGEKERPHCRQIVLFAATYSICLKPQCGHSTLALAGDDLITSSEDEGQIFNREPRRQAWPILRGEQPLAGWMLISRSSRWKPPICR